YETKWDGVRALGFLSNGEMRLLSRNNKDVSARYPELSSLTEAIPATSAIVDGEIVVLDKQGHSTFQLLQARVGLKNAGAIARLARESPVVYWLFDLLYYNGFDLRSAPLLQRKTLLQQLLHPHPTVRYSEHTVGDGDQRYRAAQRDGL